LTDAEIPYLDVKYMLLRDGEPPPQLITWRTWVKAGGRRRQWKEHHELE